MNPPPLFGPQEIKDCEHLKLLTIFHYVVGAITMAFSCLFILHVGMGISLVTHPEMWNSGPGNQAPPPFVGYILAAFAAVGVLIGWTIGALCIYSGRCIKRRTKRMFSLVMAGVNCAFFPFGTGLGVFTFVVLLRDSVKQMYETSNPALQSIPTREEAGAGVTDHH